MDERMNVQREEYLLSQKGGRSDSDMLGRYVVSHTSIYSERSGARSRAAHAISNNSLEDRILELGSIGWERSRTDEIDC